MSCGFDGAGKVTDGGMRSRVGEGTVVQVCRRCGITIESKYPRICLDCGRLMVTKRIKDGKEVS